MNWQTKHFFIAVSIISIILGTSLSSLSSLPIDRNNTMNSQYIVLNTNNHQLLAKTQVSTISQQPINATTSGYLTDYNFNATNIRPFDIIGDKYGNIWFTDFNQNYVFKLDPRTNNYTAYPLPSGVTSFKLAYDGNHTLWLTDYSFSDPSGYRNIIQFDMLTGKSTLYPVPTQNGSPFDIYIQNSTTIWFTEWQGNKIGRLNLGNPPSITEYTANCVDPQVCGPVDITLGPQNNIWYVETYSSAFVKFNPNTHQQQRIDLPNKDSAPVAIVFDKNGNIWTGEHASSSNLIHYNPVTNNFTMFAVPTPSNDIFTFDGLNDVALDSYGNVWFVEHFTNHFGFLNTTTNTVMTYLLPRNFTNRDDPGPAIQWLYIDKNNTIWYPEWGKEYIDAINESMVPSIKVQLNNSYISTFSGSSTLLTLNVTASLESTKSLLMGPYTQNSQAYSTSYQGITFTTEEVSNATIAQDQHYSFLVKVNISTNIKAGTYYIPLGVSGSNYTATTTLIIQVNNIQDPNLIYSFIILGTMSGIVAIVLLVFIIKKKVL